MDYSYTPDCKLASRTWARGVTTSYTYDLGGALTNINYSDGTPAVSFAYDRAGQVRTITDATGTRTFTYNDAQQLGAETNAFASISRDYNSVGRPTGYSAGANNSARTGYDSLGRLSSATSGLSAVNYAYAPSSDLLAGYALADPVSSFAMLQ